MTSNETKTGAEEMKTTFQVNKWYTDLVMGKSDGGHYLWVSSDSPRALAFSTIDAAREAALKWLRWEHHIAAVRDVATGDEHYI